MKGGLRVFINEERGWCVWMGMGVVVHSLQKQTWTEHKEEKEKVSRGRDE